MSAVVVTGEPKAYAWGIVNGLAAWTSKPTNGPEAELWFGTHDAGPSPLKEQLGGGDAISSSLLVKILAAAKPLSIQIHPDADAISWINTHGQQHLLADDHLKAEMLIAVESFDVLVGLRDVRSATKILSALGPDYAEAGRALEHGGWRELLRWMVSSAPAADISAALDGLSSDEQRIMQKVVSAFADDPSLPVAFMMTPHTLAPGQAMYVDVGTIHAYVNGLGVEVMVSCDNVLRLGLTNKEIAVDAALASLNPVGVGVFLDGADGRYEPRGAPFSVRKISGPAQIPAHSTVLCTHGSALLSGPGGQAELAPGEAVLVGNDEHWQITATPGVWLAHAG